MPEPEDLKTRVAAYICETDHVSFAELSRHFGESFYTGPNMLEVRKNIILWGNLSHEAAVAIKELIKEGIIEPHPASILTYVVDGRVPNLPVVEGDVDYKTPHWLPSVLRPAPAHRPRSRNAKATTPLS